MNKIYSVILVLMWFSVNTFSIELEKVFEIKTTQEVNRFSYLKEKNIVITIANVKNGLTKQVIVSFYDSKANKQITEKTYQGEIGFSKPYISYSGKLIAIDTLPGKEDWEELSPNDHHRLRIFTPEGNVITTKVIDSYSEHCKIRFSPNDKYLLVYEETTFPESMKYKQTKTFIDVIKLNKEFSQKTIKHENYISDIIFKDDNSIYIANDLLQVDLLNLNGGVIKNNVFNKNETINKGDNYIYMNLVGSSTFLLNNTSEKQLFLADLEKAKILWSENYKPCKEFAKHNDIILFDNNTQVILNKDLGYQGNIEPIGEVSNIAYLKALFGNTSVLEQTYTHYNWDFGIYDAFLLIVDNMQMKIFGYKINSDKME